MNRPSKWGWQIDRGIHAERKYKRHKGTYTQRHRQTETKSVIQTEIHKTTDTPAPKPVVLCTAHSSTIPPSPSPYALSFSISGLAFANVLYYLTGLESYGK